MQFNYHIDGGDFANAGKASSAIKKTLKQIAIDPVVVKRLVVALYEAEVNVVAHAFEGDITVVIDDEKICVTLSDRGPGIEDIDRAMQEGYSTASPAVREMGFGAGMGLPNIRNNADELKVDSRVGKGTTVEITVFFDGRGNKTD